MNVARADVVRAARGWIGTRWQHQAARRGVACDCVGLVLGVARELQLTDLTLPVYQRTADGVTLLAMACHHMHRIDRARLRPGDVALFRFEAYPAHMGIVADYLHGGLSLVHASAPARAVVEHALDAVWRDRMIAAFCLPGLVDE